mmetsp:Transcript_36276/g.71877  ORF Transcript_36276/g.71877 Transcript_36276/m.71877 type:complete len:315 (-) Transcript_36276:557-1501(-)
MENPQTVAQKDEPKVPDEGPCAEAAFEPPNLAIELDPEDNDARANSQNPLGYPLNSFSIGTLNPFKGWRDNKKSGDKGAAVSNEEKGLSSDVASQVSSHGDQRCSGPRDPPPPTSKPPSPEEAGEVATAQPEDFSFEAGNGEARCAQCGVALPMDAEAIDKHVASECAKKRRPSFAPAKEKEAEKPPRVGNFFSSFVVGNTGNAASKSCQPSVAQAGPNELEAQPKAPPPPPPSCFLCWPCLSAGSTAATAEMSRKQTRFDRPLPPPLPKLIRDNVGNAEAKVQVAGVAASSSSAPTSPPPSAAPFSATPLSAP